MGAAAFGAGFGGNHRGQRVGQQIFELERFDQIGVPDHRAVGDVEIGLRGIDLVHPRHAARRASRRCGTRRHPPAWCAACGRATAPWACRRWRGAGDRSGRGFCLRCGLLIRGWPCCGRSSAPARRAAARPKTTRSVSELEPSRLAPCTEAQAASPTAIRPGDGRIGIGGGRVQRLAVIVRGDAAHVVVDRRQHRDRLARQIDAGEDARALGDARQPLVQHLRIEMVEMEEDVVLLRPDAAALADFERHAARDHVADWRGPWRSAHSAP